MSDDERLELRGLKLDWSPERTEHALARVQGRVVRRRRVTRVALAGVVLVSSAGLVLVTQRRPVQVASVAVQSPSAAEMTLRDGSLIRADPVTSEVKLVQESPTRVQLELVRGSAYYRVTRDPARSFEVRAGAVTVTVVGTEFSVERRGAQAWVSVTRGKVRVSWGENERERSLVSAGESGLFPPAAPALPAAASSASAAPASSSSPPRAQASQVYRSHVARRAYREAYAVLQRNPGLAGDTVEELLVAADVARLSNHPAQAVPYLQRILANHKTDDRAPLAAFTLGRTLSGLGRAREAAALFGRLRASWPRSAFAEDALVRQTELTAKAGDLAAAARLAQEYERAYPQGRRRAEVRRSARLE